mgnify:CR=1 FL=1
MLTFFLVQFIFFVFINFILNYQFFILTYFFLLIIELTFPLLFSYLILKGYWLIIQEHLLDLYLYGLRIFHQDYIKFISFVKTINKDLEPSFIILNLQIVIIVSKGYPSFSFITFKEGIAIIISNSFNSCPFLKK